MSINKEIQQKEIFERLNKISNRAIKLVNFVSIYDYVHPFFIRCVTVKEKTLNVKKDIIDLEINIDKRVYKTINDKLMVYKISNIEVSGCCFNIQNMPEKLTQYEDQNYPSFRTCINYDYYAGYLVIKIGEYATEVTSTRDDNYHRFVPYLIKLFKIPYHNQLDSYNIYINLGCYKTLSDIEAIDVLERWCSEAILERM